jgi:transposase
MEENSTTKKKKEKDRTLHKWRSQHLKKNKGAYNKLKEEMVTNGDMKLHEFREYYRPVLNTKEKKKLMEMHIDPFSVKGLKYVGDCKRAGKELGEEI